jgi:hypothetical protein
MARLRSTSLSECIDRDVCIRALEFILSLQAGSMADDQVGAVHGLTFRMALRHPIRNRA